MNDANVAILGASPKGDRYSNMVHSVLQEQNYRVLPVHPIYQEILGDLVYSSLANIPPQKVHSLLMYVNAQKSSLLTNEILALAPQRVIFNPGAENRELMKTLQKNGILCVEACSLVLLRTNQFFS